MVSQFPKPQTHRHRRRARARARLSKMAGDAVTVSSIVSSRDNVERDSWRAATDGRSGGCAHETYTRRRFEQRCGRSIANAARASTHLGVRTNPPHNACGTAVVVSDGSTGRRRDTGSTIVGAAAELLSAQDASQGARAATSTWRRRQGQWQQGRQRQECAHVTLPSAR